MDRPFLESLLGLEGRTAVVTGDASGIGAGISNVLSRAGAHVVIADINEGVSAGQVQALRGRGLRASAARVDLGSEAEVVQACRQIVAEHGMPVNAILPGGVVTPDAIGISLAREVMFHCQARRTYAPDRDDHVYGTGI